MGLHSLPRLGYGNRISLASWYSCWRQTWHRRLLFHTSSKLDENFPNINLTGSYLRTRGVNNPTPSHRIIRSPYPDITFPNEPVHEFVWSGLSKWHDMKALTCASTGRSYTYARARDVSHRFAAALLRHGLRPGDAVAVCLPNAPEYPLVFLGALEAGLVITALATNGDEEDMRRQLSNARPVAAVGAGHLLRRLVRAGAVAGVRWKAVVALEGLAGAEESPEADVLGSLPPGCLRFGDLVSAEDAQTARHKAPKLPDVKASDLAVIPFTSGATGPPKGVQLSHANIVTSVCQITHEAFDHCREATESFQEEMVCSVPFYHIYGMFVVMVARMRLGAHIVTIHKPAPEEYLRCLQQTQSTALNLTPSLLLWLATAPLLPARPLERVHTVMCGGSPLAPDNVARFISRLRPSVSYQQGYGCTETTTAVTQTSRWERSLGTAGFLVPNTRAKVVEVEGGGDALGAGHTGEILAKGPQVMVGYLNDEAAMQRAFDAEGWFRTGDLGFYDDEHRFHVVDRLDEVIRVSGMHTLAVAPAELEQLLRSHPGVGAAAVVALPHHAHGEVPRAFVVRAPTASGARLTERELLDLVAQRTPPYKHLVGGVTFVDALPTSPTGNVKRYLLKHK